MLYGLLYKIESFTKKPKVKSNTILNGKSLFKERAGIEIGLNIATDPSIKRRLAKLLPIIFPKTKSDLSSSDDITLTVSSGKEVPKDTSVNPSINSETPILLAKEEQASIK
ncbi:MAG: hypothetical protein OHK0017_02730 [Patescibacteria group bacterium]